MMYKVLIAFLSLLRKWLYGWAGSKLRVVKLIGIGTERISDVGQKTIPSFQINFQLLMILSSFPHHQGYTYFVPTNSIFNDVKSSLLVPWVELWLARPLADLALGLTWAHQPPSGVSRKLVQKTRCGDNIHEPMLWRPEQIFWVEVETPNEMQIRILGREFEISFGSRKLVLWDHDTNLG